MPKETLNDDLLEKVRREAKARADRKKESEEEPKPEKPSVSAGAIDRITELALNPSDDKLREMTVIDRVQGRLLPQLDVLDETWQHIFEIASFRQDANNYKATYQKARPVPPNLIGVFVHRTAQWQKSIQGSNLKSAIDLALAETEAAGGDNGQFDKDAWKED